MTTFANESDSESGRFPEFWSGIVRFLLRSAPSTRATEFSVGAVSLRVTRTIRGEIELIINYATSAAGSVRCEVLGADGEPLPGYPLAACEEIYGDEIECAVSWGAALRSNPSWVRRFACALC